MWHIIFLEDKSTVLVRAKIGSTENYQSCRVVENN